MLVMASNTVFPFFLFLIFNFQSLTYGAGGLVGGWSSADNEDGSVKEASKFAVSELNKMRNSMFNLKLDNIIQVKTQVVNGVKYHLFIDVGTTHCRKGREDNLDQCEVDRDKVERCEVKVLESPAPNHAFTLLPGFSCKHKVLLGAESDEVDDHVSQAIAQFAIQQIDATRQSSNTTRKHVLVTLQSARKQTVAGQLYKLKFLMAESQCQNDGDMTILSECPPLPNAKFSQCKAEVLIQLWMRPSHSLTRHQCVDVKGKPRDKRNAPVVIAVKDDLTPVIVKKEKQKAEKKMLIGGDGHDVGNFGAFKEFMARYNKSYATDKELKWRWSVFRDNMKRVVQMNEGEQGPRDVKAKYGATVFSDLTEAEFRKHYLTPKWDLSKRPRRQSDVPTLYGPLPSAFDWRDHGAVTAVKNQGMCGSCWAFSTTGNIEGQWYLKKKTLLSLSEQELVDCDKVDEGCNGGLPTQAYDAIMKLGGLETESQYPYDARREKCSFTPGKARVYINDSVAISKNETEMAQWLLRNGPISIGINANVMQFYFGGVSHPWKAFCNPQSLDHGVLIVGFGSQKSFWGRETPYWLIKNSWGASWGEKGYYKIYRGDGSCGVNQMATSARVE